MAEENTKRYTHRYLARFVLEAATPLAVGNGEKNIMTDALVATDVNGLPYIPGTAIAGVIRSMMGYEQYNDLFGYQKKDNGKGSEIIFTEAKILNSKGEVVDGMKPDEVDRDELLKQYKVMPIRQHVSMDAKGVAKKHGKFDEQVVFAGTRFCFELEMLSDGTNYEMFESVLNTVHNQVFRIGGGVRCGFGEMNVVSLQTANIDMSKTDSLQLYLDKPSELRASATWAGWPPSESKRVSTTEGWTRYELQLRPMDFFLFGSGMGDEEADMTPVKARKVNWDNGIGKLVDNLVLIPATSVKGALAHRVAFHYNKIKHRYAGCVGENEPKVGDANEAVKALFGSHDPITRGALMIGDVIADAVSDKLLNHVAIDRFTGGTIDGALFQEKTSYGKGREFVMTIWSPNNVLEDGEVCSAFEAALKDVKYGRLPLGGGVNRGNGLFSAVVKKNGKEII